MRVHTFGIGVGPLALVLALALSFGTCSGPQLATAEEALELVEDGETLEFESLDEEETESVSEPEPEQVEGEPEPEAEQVEGEPEPEASERGTDIEPTSTTEDVLEHIDAATERLDAAVDLLMIGAGALGALLGYLAFGSVWRTLGGE